MNLTSCEKCGRTFGAINNEKTCTKCATAHIEDDFKKVRNYLYDNPGADVKIVSEATGVAERVILKLLKEDRIEVVDEHNALLSCERCGIGIKSGRICDVCKNDLAKDLIGVANKLKPQEDTTQTKTTKTKGVDFHIKQRR